ncbi:MAG: phosphatase PAP2 family protein [Chloroflexota bacterium]
MNDPIPDQRNRFAVIVGKVLHPYILPIPTLLAILEGLPFSEVMKWTAIIIGITILPGMSCAAVFQFRGHRLYKRQPRGPLYIIGWLSELVCLGVLLRFDAPRILVACIATSAFAFPLQWAINHWVTKVSAHAAVATGCFTALIFLGKVVNPLVTLILFACVILTLWARIVTRNHTLAQVLLGVLVGALPVIVVFPLVLT